MFITIEGNSGLPYMGPKDNAGNEMDLMHRQEGPVWMKQEVPYFYGLGCSKAMACSARLIDPFCRQRLHGIDGGGRRRREAGPWSSRRPRRAGLWLGRAGRIRITKPVVVALEEFRLDSGLGRMKPDQPIDFNTFSALGASKYWIRGRRLPPTL